MPAAFEDPTEGVDVVAQVGARIDERIAHARLRRKVHHVREPAVTQQALGGGGDGQVDRVAAHARGGELVGAGAL